MLISQAFAQDVPTATTTSTAMPAPGMAAPGAGAAFASNMGLVLVLVIMFYILLIRPQQKRFKDHSTMLSGLKVGEKVVTGGGLIGTIVEFIGNEEVVIDLGSNVKVTAVRSTLHGKDSALMRKPASASEKK